MSDDPYTYLRALASSNRSWRWRRWRNPPRVLLWAVRRRWPSKQTLVDMGPWGMVSGSRGFYADRRDFKEALRQRSVKQLGRVAVCWLRGHDMPIQVCCRCGCFIP